jgi:hypothetical protein
MPIEAYLPTPGASFGPEAVTNMGKAFEGAVDVFGIGPRDETKREAVARFIIKLAEIDGGVDAASLRDKVVMALDASCRAHLTAWLAARGRRLRRRQPSTSCALAAPTCSPPAGSTP